MPGLTLTTTPVTQPLPSSPSTPAQHLIASLPNRPPPPPTGIPPEILATANTLDSFGGRLASAAYSIRTLNPTNASFQANLLIRLRELNALLQTAPLPLLTRTHTIPPTPVHTPASNCIIPEPELTAYLDTLASAPPSSPRLISATSSELTFEFPPVSFFGGIPFGPFTVTLSLATLLRESQGGMSFKYALRISTPNPLPGILSDRAAFHPHINSSGSLCFGNFDAPIVRALACGDLPTFIPLLWDWLRIYNPLSPYYSIDHFTQELTRQAPSAFSISETSIDSLLTVDPPHDSTSSPLPPLETALPPPRPRPRITIHPDPLPPTPSTRNPPTFSDPLPAGTPITVSPPNPFDDDDDPNPLEPDDALDNDLEPLNPLPDNLPPEPPPHDPAELSRPNQRLSVYATPVSTPTVVRRPITVSRPATPVPPPAPPAPDHLNPALPIDLSTLTPAQRRERLAVFRSIRTAANPLSDIPSRSVRAPRDS